MSHDGIRCMLMRGGTSKGAYFVSSDLPSAASHRDRLLLELMGSPDPRQIDGIGGAHPLTSKVAIVAPAQRDDADVAYLFLQVAVDQARVDHRQNCGNLLAGVGPFAVERAMIDVDGPEARIRIHMVNTDAVAVARFPLDAGRPVYRGDTAISGVPGTAAAIQLDFADTAGSSCGALLPTGNMVDEVAGVACTLVDNGMPVVVVAAKDLGVTGYEDCETLEAHADLRARLEEIRLAAGPLMGLGDVADATIPKLTLVAPPRHGGHVSTRTFIPHRCHQAIGVLGAVSVATACRIPGSTASAVTDQPDSAIVSLEHPSGSFEATIELEGGPVPAVRRAGIVRTARKLMDGLVFPR